MFAKIIKKSLMLSFRQKILIANIIVATLFLSLMFPMTNRFVKAIVSEILEDRAKEISQKIQGAKNSFELLQLLKREKVQLFFRVSLINDKHQIVYDTHSKKVLGTNFQVGFVAKHPEVIDALEHGVGYSQGFSKLLSQDFSYVAKRFESHGKTYILRTAFPYKHIMAMTDHMFYGLLLVGIMTLVLYGAMTFSIFHLMTKPIQKIIDAIRPYQEEKQNYIPSIELDIRSPSDDFYRLADTLNSLSERVKQQIAHLVQERNEKEALLQSLDEGVIAVDHQMKILYANDMALTLLKQNKERLLFQNFDILGRKDFYDLLERCQREEKPCELNTTIGEHPKYYLFVIATPRGKDKGAILVLQDKSSDFRMIEMRKEFVANASHELKTPITIIQGFAETLHDNPDLPKETNIEITQKITQNCQRMTKIITNLLTLADIENIPRSKLQNCDVLHLIEDSQKEIASVYPQIEIIVEKKCKESIIVADPDLLSFAIRNLIDNAAKYSGDSTKIVVGVEELDTNIKISIQDFGIGIAKEHLELVFQRFYTIQKVSHTKSSGLGLSIVKTIIEKHFGVISLDSELGKGSTFTISLPKTYKR